MEPIHKTENNGQMIGHLSMFLAALFFGLNIPALKVLMPDWLSFTDATIVRVLGAAVLFWIASIFIKNDKIEKKDWWLIIVGGMFGLFFFLYLFAIAVALTSPIDVSIIMTLPPIMVVIISTIIYKTKLSKLKILGVLLSLAGALMIILLQHDGDGATRSMKGNLYGVLSGLCYAFYLIIIKRPSEKYKPITLLRWIFLFSAIVAIPFASRLAEAKIFTDVQFEPMAILAFVIFFPTFLSYLLIPISIKKIGQELVSMYQYLIPVVATVAAIIMKLDKLEWDQPVAAVIILIGVYITSLSEKRENAGKL